MKKKTNPLLGKESMSKLALQILCVAFAGVLGGVSFKTFFESTGIIPTGMSGFSLIIHNLFLRGDINIPTSIIYLVINIVIFAFALKVFGWKFLLLSGVGIGFYTLGMQFGAIPGIANLPVDEIDRLLYCIVGGMLFGFSVGLALRFGGSTGGSDIAGALINKHFPKIKTGYCLLFINAVVLILGVVTTGEIVIGLYALVTTVLSSMATNLVLDDSKRVVAFYIICDKDEEIAQAILEKFHRGVTRMEAEGMFSKKKKTMLLSLIPKLQAHEIKRLVNEIDENAFVYSSAVTETLGDGDFMKEVSIFKNKVKKAKSKIKNTDKLTLNSAVVKEKIFKKRRKYRAIQNESQSSQTPEDSKHSTSKNKADAPGRENQ